MDIDTSSSLPNKPYMNQTTKELLHAINNIDIVEEIKSTTSKLPKYKKQEGRFYDYKKEILLLVECPICNFLFANEDWFNHVDFEKAEIERGIRHFKNLNGDYTCVLDTCA